MSDALEELLSIAGPALGAPPTSSEAVPRKLAPLLEARDGFYAFESALHVLPLDAEDDEMGLVAWNEASLWRRHYGDLADGHLFFAEDVFGGQFSLHDGAFCTWDPETGAHDVLATDLDGWARAVLDDFEVLTGHPLAHEWQAANGPLPDRHRLTPITPFFLGGEFSLSNLRLIDAVEGMRMRADVAVQVADLPDGTRVRLRHEDGRQVRPGQGPER